MTMPVEFNTNISSNTGFNMPNVGNSINSNQKPKSIFDLQPSLNNYDNDIMGANIFSSANLSQPVGGSALAGGVDQMGGASVGLPQVSGDLNSVRHPQNFGGSALAGNTTLGENVSVESSQVAGLNSAKQISNNPEENNVTLQTAQLTDKSNKYRNLGTFLGFLAPIAGNAFEMFKGKPFARAFNLKQLAITSPLLAIAGFGIGAFIDSCLAANKAKNALQS